MVADRRTERTAKTAARLRTLSEKLIQGWEELLWAEGVNNMDPDRDDVRAISDPLRRDLLEFQRLRAIDRPSERDFGQLRADEQAVKGYVTTGDYLLKRKLYGRDSLSVAWATVRSALAGWADSLTAAIQAPQFATELRDEIEAKRLQDEEARDIAIQKAREAEESQKAAMAARIERERLYESSPEGQARKERKRAEEAQWLADQQAQQRARWDRLHAAPTAKPAPSPEPAQPRPTPKPAPKPEPEPQQYDPWSSGPSR
jgi:hypothetical protein